ncbi:MAG: hypothetical protein JWO08_3831 [Verrucomicrobiaceae bacterium]|nr:hypothetical protein [Verrucomicrobiaceae bacterium]
MKKAFGDYRLITGSARTRGSLWEGPDHLLYIESEGFLVEFIESYKRIDYSKIQAITYGLTRTWAWTIVWQVALTALLIWPVVYFFSVNGYRYIDPVSLPPASMAFLGFVLMLVVLVVNLVKGPTCVCKIQTAVQSLKLKPVVRVKQARKLAEKVAALCLQHQGALPVPDSPEALAAAANGTGSVFSVAPLLQSKAPFTGSPLMRWGFLLLMLAGFLTAGEVFVKSFLYFVADVTFAGGAGIMLVVALMRSTRVDLPPALKGTLWAVAVNYVFSLILAFGIYIYASVSIATEVIKARKRTFSDDIEMRLLNWMANAGFDELSWAAWLLIGVGALNILFALLGLPSVLRQQTPTIVAPPPLQPLSPVMPAAPSSDAKYRPPSAS